MQFCQQHLLNVFSFSILRFCLLSKCLGAHSFVGLPSNAFMVIFLCLIYSCNYPPKNQIGKVHFLMLLYIEVL